DNAMIGNEAEVRVRVMDFGLAGGEPVPTAATHDGTAVIEAPEITRSTALGGTPAYMAPEQFAGRVADARADQFAFCVSLWEALTGTRPCAGATVLELADAVTQGRIRDGWPTQVPVWLRRVLVRGLAADPTARWPDMNALVAALLDDPARRTRRRIALGGIA